MPYHVSGPKKVTLTGAGPHKITGLDPALTDLTVEIDCSAGVTGPISITYLPQGFTNARSPSQEQGGNEIAVNTGIALSRLARPEEVILEFPNGDDLGTETVDVHLVQY